jgi:Na+-transporting methylmalonyl-CoA/oxaloacetate decarboxylase gamma subunit
MNLDTLNRYVLGVVGVFVVLLYLGMMFAGCSELISRLSKRGGRWKGPKVGTGGRSMSNAKKSI